MGTLADSLRALVGAKPSAPQTGAVAQAAQQLGGRGYQLHVQEAKAMGEAPMSQQAWAQSQVR